jgi:hypothetical protein
MDESSPIARLTPRSITTEIQSFRAEQLPTR